jgi:hypothetical protein
MVTSASRNHVNDNAQHGTVCSRFVKSKKSNAPIEYNFLTTTTQLHKNEYLTETPIPMLVIFLSKRSQFATASAGRYVYLIGFTFYLNKKSSP